jgi:hypothetical protein
MQVLDSNISLVSKLGITLKKLRVSGVLMKVKGSTEKCGQALSDNVTVRKFVCLFD